MSALAPTLQAFFTQRLMAQRHASAHTVAAYRDTFRLLLGFVEEQAGKRPAALDIEDLDAPRILAFPGSPRTQSGQHRADPQRSPCGDPLDCSASPRYQKLLITRPISSRRLSAVGGSWDHELRCKDTVVSRLVL